MLSEQECRHKAGSTEAWIRRGEKTVYQFKRIIVMTFQFCGTETVSVTTIVENSRPQFQIV